MFFGHTPKYFSDNTHSFHWDHYSRITCEIQVLLLVFTYSPGNSFETTQLHTGMYRKLENDGTRVLKNGQSAFPRQNISIFTELGVFNTVKTSVESSQCFGGLQTPLVFRPLKDIFFLTGCGSQKYPFPRLLWKGCYWTSNQRSKKLCSNGNRFNTPLFPL